MLVAHSNETESNKTCVCIGIELTNELTPKLLPHPGVSIQKKTKQKCSLIIMLSFQNPFRLLPVLSH